jgi:hypothetical protein
VWIELLIQVNLGVGGRRVRGGYVEEIQRGRGEDGDHEGRTVLCSQHRRDRGEGQREVWDNA